MSDFEEIHRENTEYRTRRALQLQQQSRRMPQVVDKRNSLAGQTLQREEDARFNARKPLQKKENNTGLPDKLKSGMENFSGYSLDHVKVHYNSSKPAAVQAHAYAQGSNIHLGSGQEKHLPHELGHVVQQMQGRVKPTTSVSGVSVNDNAALESEADLMGNEASKACVSQLQGISSRLSYASQSVMNAKAMETPFSAVIQRDPWDANANLGEVAEGNAQNARFALVVAPNPLAVGPVQLPGLPPTTEGNQKHFDPDMLTEVSAILNYLPAEHIIGNPELARVVMEHDGGGGASYFGDNQLHVVVPFDVDSWIYLSVNKWPVGDLATTLLSNIGYADNPNHQHLGAKKKEMLSRDIVGTGTISNKLSMVTEGFVEWLLKHETGHSVDEAIGWSDGHHYRSPAMGGWLVHEGAGADTTLPGMRDTLLNASGLMPNIAQLNLEYNNHTARPDYLVSTLDNALINYDPNRFDIAGRGAALNAFNVAVPGGYDSVIYLEKMLKEGMTSPWQKGGEGGMPYGNRTYQVEYQHSRWVSYISNKYAQRNSNYQYSGPEEWFAETYAHYFKHSSWKFWREASSQWGGKLNDPAARTWFRNNLDPVNAPGGVPALIPANALHNIAAPMPAVPAQNAVVAPGLGRRIWEKAKGFAITATKVTGHAIFNILAGALAVPATLIKYLLYVPAKMLWRKFLSLF